MQHMQAPRNWHQVGRIISCQLAFQEAQLPKGIVWRSRARHAILTLPASSDDLAVAGPLFNICRVLTVGSAGRHRLCIVTFAGWCAFTTQQGP